MRWEYEPAVEPVRVGLVGCGNISSVYLTNCADLPPVQVVACADLVDERARARADEYGVPHCLTVDELLADPEVELVLNLTVPAAHAELSLRALEADKHVYTEKPLALSRESGRRIVEVADERGLLVGCAPDTFLGAGLQTCRRLIDLGAIGRPVAASAFSLSHGMEWWHPNPDFFFQAGGGPLFDIGPYSITALVNLIGPVRRVSMLSQRSFPQRTIGNGVRLGETIPVDVPTHVASLLEFGSDAIASHIESWDVWHHHLPILEVYGTEGSLLCGDPNEFLRDPPQLRRAGWSTWVQIHSDSPYTRNWRGLGVADLAMVIRRGGVPQASGELAYHVLDVMCSLEESVRQGQAVEVASTTQRPAPLTIGLHVPGSGTIETSEPDFWNILVPGDADGAIG